MLQDSESLTNQDEEDQENPSFPGFTSWERTNYCCCNNAYVINNETKTVFLGHWEVTLSFPFTVCFFIIAGYIIPMTFIFPNWKTKGVFLAVLFSILFFLFFYSYFRVIIDGPGYLPFYWPMKRSDHTSTETSLEPVAHDDSSSLLHSDDLSPSGVITTKRQYYWAKKRPRPPRCTLSKEARRYVIRPDHICVWTSSWIGKRNYKFFLLFNIWGLIYILFATAVIIVEMIIQIRSEMASPIIGIYLIYLFFAFLFAGFTGIFACSHTKQMCDNQTTWEIWKKVDPKAYDQGCIKNVEDVCGPISKWYTYPCPISPFTQITNNELIENYPSVTIPPKEVSDKIT